VEQLQKSLRTARKFLERGEWSSTVASLKELAARAQQSAADQPEQLRQQAQNDVQQAITKLQTLKRKVEVFISEWSPFHPADTSILMAKSDTAQRSPRGGQTAGTTHEAALGPLGGTVPRTDHG
jgi:hypothetical protein